MAAKPTCSLLLFTYHKIISFFYLLFFASSHAHSNSKIWVLRPSSSLPYLRGLSGRLWCSLNLGDETPIFLFPRLYILVKKPAFFNGLIRWLERAWQSHLRLEIVHLVWILITRHYESFRVLGLALAAWDRFIVPQRLWQDNWFLSSW